MVFGKSDAEHEVVSLQARNKGFKISPKSIVVKQLCSGGQDGVFHLSLRNQNFCVRGFKPQPEDSKGLDRIRPTLGHLN
ncbi:hypothetical protein K1718_15250 [Roseibium porphyridii]|uniref:Uncharacterized protein n=1 Tax=Roseibium porphyridii TaxID=2866279 RepID=A0ABY8EX84_9HYPH|nr:hypothetical protein [Roseibium sp. KMA01]WFE87524.1 hypothetical protein K1718_15250 [Roseibium sp. KMA01]